VGIVIVYWRSAELLGVGVNVISVMTQTLQPFVAIISVKPTVSEDSSSSVD
jgi:hypothetical protein